MYFSNVDVKQQICISFYWTITSLFLTPEIKHVIQFEHSPLYTYNIISITCDYKLNSRSPNNFFSLETVLFALAGSPLQFRKVIKLSYNFLKVKHELLTHKKARFPTPSEKLFPKLYRCRRLITSWGRYLEEVYNFDRRITLLLIGLYKGGIRTNTDRNPRENRSTVRRRVFYFQ